MRKVLLFLSISILWSVNLHAFEFQLKSSTTAPVFLGIGAAAQFDENWGIEAQIGQAPRVYAELIGNYAASSSGNSSYDDVIIAAFENNFIFKFGGFYKIQNGEGWKVATNFYLVTASILMNCRVGRNAVLGFIGKRWKKKVSIRKRKKPF